MQAQGSKRSLAYIAETVYGETPALPQTKGIDFVDFTGNLNAPEIRSAAVRSNRQLAGSRRGNLSTEGELSVELSPTNYDELLEAVLQGTWSTHGKRLAVPP